MGGIILKPVHSFTTRALSCLLAALLAALCIIPASAAEVIGSGVEATYDEAYYATTDYYGNLTEGSVVKSYVMNGAASLTDYGDYDEVVNLTDGTVPSTAGGCTTFDFASSAPTHFYFEGRTAAPFETLPWKLSMHYTLNGVPTKAEELAGKTGVVEIFFDAVPNKTASEYARNNYTLEAMAIFNQDDILSLEAEGAQIQLIGNLRAVLFVILPGEEQHFSIRVGSEDFSFGGMTFLMVPATLSQLSEISKLTERKDDIEDNYRKLSDSLDVLLDSVNGISSNLYVTANGLDELNTARGIISNGKGNIYDKTDTALNDLKALNDTLAVFPGHLDKGAVAVKDTTDALDDVSDALRDLQEETEDAKDDLDGLQSCLRRIRSSTNASASDIKDLGKFAERVKGDINEFLPLITELNIQVGGDDVTIQGKTASELRAALDQADILHGFYTNIEQGAMSQDEFLISMLMFADSTLTQEAAIEKCGQMNTFVTTVETNAAGLVEAETAPDMETAIFAVLETLDAEKQAAYQKAKGLASLYAGVKGGAMEEDAFFTAVLTSGGHTAEEAQQLWMLFHPTQRLNSGVEELCDIIATDGLSGDLNSLLTHLGSALGELDDLSDMGDDLLDALDDALDAADDLGDVVDTYAPDLQKTLTEANATVTTLMTTVTDTHSLLTSLRDLLKSAGEPLDSGTKKTLEGLAASLRATAGSLGTTGNVKSAKNNISGIVEDVWNEYTGEANNLLLIDANAAPQSLTDSRNPSPTSIQVLIRTQEIKTAEPPTEEIKIQEAAETTFFQRVAQMFKDFWTAITGIFR